MSWPLSRRALLAGLGAMVLAQPIMAEARPPAWAVPVPLAGVPNLNRITPDLYRAAQPTAEGFVNLHAMGIKTIVSLRQTVDDADVYTGSGLALLQVPMKSRHVGEDDAARIVTVLQTLQRAMVAGPVLFHCRHGADRTGTICAAYRMVFQGWTHEAALDELLHGGYGFHPIWANIPRFVAQMDIDDIRMRVAG